MADGTTSTSTTRARLALGSASPAPGRTARRRAGDSRVVAFAASRRDARPRPQLIDESGPPRLFTNPPASSPTPNEVLALVDAALKELQPRLARLIGADGYDALLERAVHRAAARQAIPPTAGGGHVDRVRGALAVIAELIVLLVDFLGQDLTRRVALGNCRWSALLDGTGDDPEPHT